MTINIQVSQRFITKIKQWFENAPWYFFVITPAVALAITATSWSFMNDATVAYGDAESHLNIAKRVVHSITPGAAQLGGIWLPLPHIMMIPFVFFDGLWRTGLAGSIVSGFCYILTAVVIYKLTLLLTKHKLAAVTASWVFMTNPNIMYLQSTSMTELPLIVFFMLSSYFFIKFLKGINEVPSILLAALFGFCSVLSRYDGWFLVLFQAGIIFLLGISKRWKWRKIEGYIVLYGTLAFFGIALWFLWDFLILGNAFYFTQSEFSARTQQQAWLAKGQLPAYHDLPLAFLYYFATAMSNSGIILFFAALVGLIWFIKDKFSVERILISMLLFVPFIFNVFTLFAGQSVIFIPHVTPVGFEWRLFNVRYGVMMMPLVSFLIGFIMAKAKTSGKLVVLLLFFLQVGLYSVGYSSVVSYADGIEGLSHAKRPDAEGWIRDNYDGGLVLMDDYARTVSVVRSGIPMQQIIYIGNKPYWEESLQQPQKYARWVVMQKNDAVWNSLYEKEETQGELYKYFQKVYTSPDILIFKKI